MVRKRQVSNDDIIMFVAGQGIATSDDISKFTGYNRQHLSLRIRELTIAGKLQRFFINRSRGGGSVSRTLNPALVFGKYFNVRCYYTDEDDASDMLLSALGPIEQQDKRGKRFITVHLHNCLPRRLFDVIYINYSSPDALRFPLSGASQT